MNVWGCEGGWEKRKISRSCVKFDSFSSQGFSLTNFSFSSCRFPSCREKLWLSGWKKLNGAETKLFDVLSDWVVEKTEVGRLPQPHSNFSHKNWLTSRVLWFLVIFPPSQTHAEFWRQSLVYLANSLNPGSTWESRASLWGRRDKVYPERHIHPKVSPCWPFWNPPLRLGRVVSRESGSELHLHNFSLYEFGWVNYQTLDTNINNFKTNPNTCLSTSKLHCCSKFD